MMKHGKAQQTTKPAKGQDADPFELTRFFPYQLAVLAERISLAVAQLYGDRFNLSRSEWRILAALGHNGAMTAKDLGPYSTLDKMQVSRAVAGLEEGGYIAREEDASDRRAKILQLTKAGQALYRKLVPLVVEREQLILDALEPDDRAALSRIMECLQTRADSLLKDHA